MLSWQPTMPNWEQYVWRWDLPDNLEPDGFWCVTITIPGDQQYMDALTGALGLLTLSKSWARHDGDADARTVAHTWENALYMNPFAVVQDCPTAEPPPIPDLAAAKDQAAGIVNHFWANIITYLNSCALNADDCASCVEDVMALLTPYGANDATRGILSKLCSDLNGLTTEARAAYQTECVWTPEFTFLYEHIIDNPFDWLNKMSDWLFSWLNQTSDTIFHDLNILAGLLGGQAVQNFVTDHGGAGGGAGFPNDCPWSYDVDFTVTDGGWIRLDETTYNNVTWASGAGWQNLADSVVAIKHAATGYVTHIDIDLDVQMTGGLRQVIFNVLGNDGPPGQVFRNDNIGNVTHIAWDGAPTAMTEPVVYIQSHSPFRGTPCESKIVHAHIAGIGTRPPELP